MEEAPVWSLLLRVCSSSNDPAKRWATRPPENQNGFSLRPERPGVAAAASKGARTPGDVGAVVEIRPRIERGCAVASCYVEIAAPAHDASEVSVNPNIDDPARAVVHMDDAGVRAVAAGLATLLDRRLGGLLRVVLCRGALDVGVSAGLALSGLVRSHIRRAASLLGDLLGHRRFFLRHDRVCGREDERRSQ